MIFLRLRPEYGPLEPVCPPSQGHWVKAAYRSIVVERVHKVEWAFCCDCLTPVTRVVGHFRRDAADLGPWQACTFEAVTGMTEEQARARWSRRARVR